MNVIDMTGLVFGRLTVVELSHSQNGAYWRCKCECGTEKPISGTSLRSGGANSCGCLQRELARARMGHVIDSRRLPFKHRQKLTWLYGAIKSRCTNPRDKGWAYYGGRGIRMCDEWMSDRIAFYRWCSENGYEPGLWIERDDVNGDYEPGNCRFATIVEQMNNKRNSRFLDWQGERMTLTQWEQRLGFPRSLIHGRITRGWSIERAMTEPLRLRAAA